MTVRQATARTVRADSRRGCPGPTYVVALSVSSRLPAFTVTGLIVAGARCPGNRVPGRAPQFSKSKPVKKH